MLSNAREYINQQTNQDQTNQFDFIQAQADSLNFIKDNTVDLVIAGGSLSQTIFLPRN
jgi:ubiquinone/menaquinone biosynthesis C-methylase UbiE